MPFHEQNSDVLTDTINSSLIILNASSLERNEYSTIIEDWEGPQSWLEHQIFTLKKGSFEIRYILNFIVTYDNSFSKISMYIL